MFVKIHHEFNQLPTEIDSSHVMLHMEAPSILDKPLPPKNFIFVIDTSSSMMGEKIDQCKSIIEKGMRLFRNCDKIALISYSEEAVLRCDWTACDEEGKRKLNNSFNNLHAMGCTNISGALFMSLSMVMHQTDVTIVFLTDGLANRGIEDTNTLVAMTKKLVSDGMNVRIHTVGVGEDHSVDMLQRICLSGTYTYVDTPESTTSAFGSILGSTYSTVYQNLTVKITGQNINFLDGFGKPLTQYTIGDLYAEEKRDLLATASFAKEGPYKVTWTISGVNIVDKTLLDKTYTLNIERGDDNETPDEAIKRRLKVISATNVMKNVVKEMENGNMEVAKTHLRSFATDDPWLARAFNVAEQSMNDVTANTRGINHSVNRVRSLQAELYTQRGTSEIASTSWQNKISRSVKENIFSV